MAEIEISSLCSAFITARSLRDNNGLLGIIKVVKSVTEVFFEHLVVWESGIVFSAPL